MGSQGGSQRGDPHLEVEGDSAARDSAEHGESAAQSEWRVNTSSSRSPHIDATLNFYMEHLVYLQKL